MNALEALGLAYRASVGHRVLVVMDRADTIRPAITLVGEQAAYLQDRVHIVHGYGAERVEVGGRGGEVVFTFRKSKTQRDYDADIVVLEGAGLMSDHERAELSGRAREVITR